MAHHFNMFSPIKDQSNPNNAISSKYGYPSQVDDDEDTTPPHALYNNSKGVHGDLGIRFAAKSVHANHYCVPTTNHT